MKISYWVPLTALCAVVISSFALSAQISEPSQPKSNATASLPFDPHDLGGVWMGDTKSGNRVLGSNAANIPEPPLDRLDQAAPDGEIDFT